MIQLQSILYPRKEVCEVPELYFHREGKRINFDGYFNLFYLEKRKKYTTIEHLILDSTLQGYDTLILVHDGADIDQIPLKAEECRRYQIAFPYEAYEKGVFSFSLIESDETTASEHVAEGFYVSDPENCRKVNIGIDICTYRRETYVERNLRQLKERLLERDELNVSEHIYIYVIDNGKTLHEHESIQKLVRLSAGKIQIIPNKNAGGAGGFTRGMLEVLNSKEKKSLTHILLMDDDAVVEPDTLVRIYGFLSTIKEEWKNITIGGAMLREDYPYMLYCAGEWWEASRVFNPAAQLDLRDFKNASARVLTAVEHEFERYSGWWCCCYSLNIVHEDNLPIPVFIHHDDIEFGRRNCENGIVFLNGVGVWHRGFDTTFPGANVYYETRNGLIDIVLHEKGNSKSCAWKYFTRWYMKEVASLNCKEARLACEAMKDFLRGPKWLWKKDPEKIHNHIREMANQMLTIDEMKESLPRQEYSEIVEQINKYETRCSADDIVLFQEKRKSVIQYFTLNGWLLPASSTQICMFFPWNSLNDLFRKKKVFLYDPISKKGVLLVKRYGDLAMALSLYVRATIEFLMRFDKAAHNYQENMRKITTRDAWEKYLGLK